VDLVHLRCEAAPVRMDALGPSSHGRRPPRTVGTSASATTRFHDGFPLNQAGRPAVAMAGGSALASVSRFHG
jgi:hypothetical protein